jgi:hypothetical protein
MVTFIILLCIFFTLYIANILYNFYKSEAMVSPLG